MKKLILLAALLAVTGCDTIAPAKPSALPAIMVIDEFWEQRRDSVPVLPDDFGQRQDQSGSFGDLAQAPEEAVDVSKYVHQFEINRGLQTGSCVTAEDGVVVTAKHILQDQRGYTLPLYQLHVGKHEVTRQVRYPCADADIAVILSHVREDSSGVRLEPMAPRERVQFYGMRTKELQQGTVSEVSDHEIKIHLDASCTGAYPGDSGGGVFDEQGRLIGVLSSFHGSESNGTADHRTIYVAPITCARGLLSEPPPVVGDPVTARYPRLVLVTDPPRCAPCKAQEHHLTDLKAWDRQGYWSMGPEASNTIQIVDPSHEVLEDLDEVEGIPCWIRISKSGEVQRWTGKKTKEEIVRMLQ